MFQGSFELAHKKTFLTCKAQEIMISKRCTFYAINYGELYKSTICKVPRETTTKLKTKNPKKALSKVQSLQMVHWVNRKRKYLRKAPMATSCLFVAIDPGLIGTLVPEEGARILRQDLKLFLVMGQPLLGAHD